MALKYRIYISFLSLLFLAATALYAYTQQFLYLGVPLGLVTVILLLQYPEYLFYALLIAIPWSIEYNFTPSLGTDLPDEPLMLLTAFASVILIVYHRKKIPGKYRIHFIAWVILFQFAWTFVTTLTSTDLLLSAKHLLAKSWYILALLAMPLYLFTDVRILKNAALILLSSMMAFMFFALASHSQNGFTFEKINDSLQPFFRNHVNYSALLVFMVPLQIACFQLSKSKWMRYGLIILMILTTGALYLSYSRGAWLALATGIIAYWLLRKRFLFHTYLAFILLAAGSVIWLKSNDRYLKFSHDYTSTIYHTDFRQHLIATYQLKDVSTAERFYRWVAGVRMIEDSWKTGLGPATFYSQYKSYTQPAFKTWVSRNEEKSTVHNYFLLLIIEQGALGLILFLLLLGALFWYAQKIYHRTQILFWKAAMLAASSILVMICTVNFLSDLIETDKVGGVFFVCIAAIVMADIKTRKESSPVH